MKLIDVKPTPANDTKKFVAEFCECKGSTKCDPKDRPKIKFGSKGSTTFIDGADKKTQENYIKRHSVNENWNKINAGSLSRYILWSAKTLEQGIKNFKARFKC
jgi:hypothetical protein